MTEIESAWHRVPGYTIDLVPCRGTARVGHGDLVVAESDRALVMKESDHADQLYVPRDDVHWEHFTATGHTSICPFKGEAGYWSLTVDADPLENVAWDYPEPFAEVAGIADHVAFYTDRLRVELVETWDGDGSVTHRFPPWGDLTDLVAALDVTPDGDGRFVAPPHPDPPLGTILDIPDDRKPRLVVEGGHLLGQAIVAASGTVPGQRVVSSSMVFSRAAMFDAPVDFDVDVLRRGRTYSTVEVRASQHGKLCSVGLLLMDAGADDAIRGSATMPDVPSPLECPPRDMGVTGREIRVVDGAYTQDLDHVGPPELYVWVRLRDAPDRRDLQAALVAQPTTHWTIAAAMRPHEGVSEALAHRSLSTGIMGVDVAFHDDVDVSRWLLYANPAVYAGRGHAQGQGRVFTADGRLAATYAVHAMVRAFATDPSTVGGFSSAM